MFAYLCVALSQCLLLCFQWLLHDHKVLTVSDFGIFDMRFFADSGKTAPVFGVPYGANLAQLLVEKIEQVRSGHRAITS